MANDLIKILRAVRSRGFLVEESRNSALIRRPGEDHVIAMLPIRASGEGHGRMIQNAKARLKRAGINLATPIVKASEKRVKAPIERAIATTERVDKMKPDQLFKESGWYTITPELAVEMLAWNKFNRRVSQPTVDKYARTMKQDKWLDSGQPIILSRAGTSSDGKLVPRGTVLNGQHQLLACYESETSFRVFVVIDVDPAAYVVMDSGKKRSIADAIGMDRDRYAATRGTATALWWRYKSALMERPSILPSTEEVVDLLAKTPGVMEAVARVQSGSRMMPTGPLAFVYLACSEIDKDKADEFIEGFISGHMIPKSSPIYQFRDHMIKRGNSRAKISRTEYLALALKAFRLFNGGKTVKLLRWSVGGPNPEPFPYLYMDGGK